MKKAIGILLTLLLNLVNYEAQAYDFSVVNAEGVEIYYKHIGDGRVEVTSGPTKYSGDVIIPEEVNYANIMMCKITCIGKKAFFECDELSSIIIGNNVTYIEDYAFQGCSGLISIKFSLVHLSEAAGAGDCPAEVGAGDGSAQNRRAGGKDKGGGLITRSARMAS